MTKPRRGKITRKLIDYYVGSALEHDPFAPLPDHVERYRAKREPPNVPVMCSNIYCRDWVFAECCARCGTEMPLD